MASFSVRSRLECFHIDVGEEGTPHSEYRLFNKELIELCAYSEISLILYGFSHDSGYVTPYECDMDLQQTNFIIVDKHGQISMPSHIHKNYASYVSPILSMVVGVWVMANIPDLHNRTDLGNLIMRSIRLDLPVHALDENCLPYFDMIHGCMTEYSTMQSPSKSALLQTATIKHYGWSRWNRWSI